MNKNNKAEMFLSKASNINNALAMVKVNQTLWLDADDGMWDCEKPETIRETLKRNTILYIKHNVNGDIDESCKYIACNRNGVARIGMFNLIDAINYYSFNIRDVMNVVSYRNCEIMGVDFSLTGIDIDIYNIERHLSQ